MTFFEGDMSERDRKANAGAVFYPAREPGEAPLHYGLADGLSAAGGTDETYGPPCVEIGGVQVYVYVRDGILVISLHYDTADTSLSGPFAVYGDMCVPTVVKAGGSSPAWEALPDDALTEADARQLRKTGDSRPGDWVLPGWIDGE